MRDTDFKINQLHRLIKEKNYFDFVVDKLNLSTRLKNTLKSNNVITGKDLLNVDGTELGLGIRGVEEIINLFQDISMNYIDNNDSIITSVNTENNYDRFIEQEKKNLEQIINSLKERSRIVIIKRFGLLGVSDTLQNISKEFNLTRQRIMQIEVQGLRIIKKEIENCEFDPILIQKLNDFAKNIKSLKDIDCVSEKYSSKGLFLLFSKLYPELYYISNFRGKTKEDFFGLVFQEQDVYHELCNVIDFLKKVKGLVEIKELNNIFSWNIQIILSLKNIVIENDCVYLRSNKITKVEMLENILRNNGKPMSVQELSELMGDAPNLITSAIGRSNQAVNIGRSIYALKEWNYIPGGINDVIKYYLEMAGEPMNIKQITNLVLKQRIVTKKSIYMALVIDKDIQRIEKGYYGLKSWGFDSEYKFYRLKLDFDVYKTITDILSSQTNPITSKDIINKMKEMFDGQDKEIDSIRIYNYLDKLIRDKKIIKTKIGVTNYYSIV
jgi:hypothetical protein